MNYQFTVGESVVIDILGSIVETVVIDRAPFKGKPVYKLQFSSGSTAVKSEAVIDSNTLAWESLDKNTEQAA